MSHLKYRADVDGLRALAVIPVVLFHCGVSIMSGGYVGVDVFFVISGFLITTAIAKDLQSGRFSIAEFYVRRIRRILPALVAVVLASLAVSVFLLDRASLANFGKSIVSVAVFASNIFFWKSSGYFEPSALTKPLLHTWSLAVEEQFYIIMPIAMGLVWRFAPKVLPPLIAAAAIVSLGLSVAAVNVAPTASFFMLPTRAWELLAGSLIALYPIQTLARFLREFLGAVGVVLILGAVFLFDEATPFPGFAALAPVAGAAFILVAGGSGGSVASQILSWRPFVAIGLISYSLYLVHWPLIVFTRYALLRDPSGLEVLALVVGSLALATASWWFVERPFRRPANRSGRVGVFLAAVLALFSLAAAGVGFVAYFSPKDSVNPAPAPGKIAQENGWLEGRCFLINQPADAWAGDLCLRTSGEKPRAVLWGDSFAAQYVPGIIANQEFLDHEVIQYTYAGCPPILSYESYARPGCHAFNAKILDVTRRYGADSVVIAARWDQLRSRGLSGLPETIDYLIRGGVRVYVIGQSPMFAFDVSVLEARKAGIADGGQSASWLPTFNQGEFDDVGRASAKATFIDPKPYFCDAGRCRYKQEGKPLFFDYGHFSDYGSAFAVSEYFPYRVKGASRGGEERKVGH